MGRQEGDIQNTLHQDNTVLWSLSKAKRTGCASCFPQGLCHWVWYGCTQSSPLPNRSHGPVKN